MCVAKYQCDIYHISCAVYSAVHDGFSKYVQQNSNPYYYNLCIQENPLPLVPEALWPTDCEASFPHTLDSIEEKALPPGQRLQTIFGKSSVGLLTSALALAHQIQTWIVKGILQHIHCTAYIQSTHESSCIPPDNDLLYSHYSRNPAMSTHAGRCPRVQPRNYIHISLDVVGPTQVP